MRKITLPNCYNDAYIKKEGNQVVISVACKEIRLPVDLVGVDMPDEVRTGLKKIIDTL